MEVDSWFGTEGKFEEPSTYRMTGTHASLEWKQQLDIVDASRKKFYAVDLLTRSYSELDLPVDIIDELSDPRFRPMAERTLDRYDPSVSIKRSDRKETIDGYEVTRVEVRVGGPGEAVHGSFQLWVSAVLEERLAAFPFRELESSRFASSPYTARWMSRAFGSLEGFPLRVDADFEIDGQRTQYTRTLVSIQQTDFSEIAFAVPAGLDRKSVV